MYHSHIIERNLASMQAALGLEFKRYDYDFIRETVERLEQVVSIPNRDKHGRPINGDQGPFTRDLSASEWEFIRNERIVCKFDFLHFFLNYSQALIVKPNDPRDNTTEPIRDLLESQRVLHNQISKLELANDETSRRGDPVDGIMLLMAKARQLGATQYGRGAMMHRALFWDDIPAMAASIDQEMVHTLYMRDQIIYEKLPWWLKPHVGYDAKDEHFAFDNLNSSITYFQANQKGGLGTGKTLNTIHLTEVGLWESQAGLDSVKRIQFDMIPTIPQSPKTLVFFESTASGRNNFWHNMVSQAWEGKSRFQVYFCPWYAEPSKYRKVVPQDWEPEHFTKEMIARVEATSPTYMDGRTVHLGLQQAYYWEFNYKQAVLQRQLGDFLANYPTTLEESFQHSGSKAFTLDAIRYAEENVRAGIPYDLVA